MKCRMILPVGLLTCVVCFGGVEASAFELFRMVGEQAAVESPPPVAEPAPLEEEGGKFEAQQKGCGEEVCEPCCRPTPLRDCGARIRCATMNLHCRIGAFGESLKGRLCVPQFCGPEVCCEPACGVESKGEVVSQKTAARSARKTAARSARKAVDRSRCLAARGCGVGAGPAASPLAASRRRAKSLARRAAARSVRKVANRSRCPAARGCGAGAGPAASPLAASRRRAKSSARKTAARSVKKVANRSRCPAARGCGAGAGPAASPLAASS